MSVFMYGFFCKIQSRISICTASLLKILLYIILLSCSFSLVNAYEVKKNSDTITISGTAIKGLLDDAVPGPYNDIFDTIRADYSGVLLLTMRPIKRAARAFYLRESDCFFLASTSPEFYRSKGVSYEEIDVSIPLKKVAVRAYTLPNSELIHSEDELKRLPIAVDVAVGATQRFIDYEAVNGGRVLFVNDVEQALSLLNQHRVSAIVAADYDVERYFAYSGKKMVYQYDPEFILYHIEDALVCWRSKKTEAFMKQVDTTLTRLKQTGEMDAILQ